MDNIVLPIDRIVENRLSINEYLVLYDIANSGSITGLINSDIDSLVNLEKKGFIKIDGDDLFLRDKASVFFAVNNDLFDKWLKTYPTAVSRKYGGKRALSPASKDTILGKKLEKKWKTVFRNNIEAQERAIRVLELQVKQDERSGNLEYFVEATRWLNEGYHEKYSYLLEEEKVSSEYSNEDYL